MPLTDPACHTAENLAHICIISISLCFGPLEFFPFVYTRDVKFNTTPAQG